MSHVHILFMSFMFVKSLCLCKEAWGQSRLSHRAAQCWGHVEVVNNRCSHWGEPNDRCGNVKRGRQFLLSLTSISESVNKLMSNNVAAQ